jgi:Rod binding domain-containing protein
MEITSIQPHVDVATLPIEQLAGNKQLDQQQKLAEVARQFEAILLRQILQNTQKTVIPSKFSDNSTAASIYHDLITQRLADSISKSGTVGLAKMLQLQLSHQIPPASTAGHDRPPEAQPTSHSGADVARPPSCSASHLSHLLTLHPANTETAGSLTHE